MDKATSAMKPTNTDKRILMGKLLSKFISGPLVTLCIAAREVPPFYWFFIFTSLSISLIKLFLNQICQKGIQHLMSKAIVLPEIFFTVLLSASRSEKRLPPYGWAGQEAAGIRNGRSGRN
jgi:hypothetical protein